jgi:RHS repeat-associated protein
LDILGLVPGVGELADGVNAAWYAAEGDYVNASLSAAAMIPGAGAAVIAAKYGKKLADAATSARGVDARVGAVDPIDVATGEMFLHQVDLELPGVLPLVLTRTHLSSYRAGISFGPTWSSTVDQRLELDEDGVAFLADEGVMLFYPPILADVPVLPEFGPRWPLRRDGAGYVVEKPDEGVRLAFAPAERGTARLAGIVDRNGNRIDVVHDAHGTPREVRHSGGYHVVFDSEDGLITGMRLRTTESSIRLASYGYDGASRLVEVTNSSGRPLRFGYDLAGRIVRWEDRNAQWYTYQYDNQGRCVRTDGSSGMLAGRLAYRHGRTVVTDTLGARRTYEFNELGQLVRDTDSLGNITLSTWDRYDRLLSRTDPLGRTTTFTYDEHGNLVRLVRPDGAATTATYNALRLPVILTGPDDAVWQRAYDARGNVLSITDPAGERTEFGYARHGHLATVTDATGATERFTTDAAGLPVTVTDPLGATTWYRRDAFGRVTRIVNPAGGATRLSWTIEGGLIARTLPNGATERWRYDGEGNQIEHVDAIGNVTRVVYGGFRLPTARVHPDGTRYEFGYDTELRLMTVTNPQGLVWRYDYDAAGRLRSETDFNGRTLGYIYDAAGQLVERTNGADERIRYVRDARGRVVEKDVAGVVTTFGYDAMGRLVRATNPDAHLTLLRDSLGRTVAETVNGRTVSSAYDPAGRRIRVTTPSGADSRWEYDATGRTVALHTAGQTLYFDRDVAGREVRRTFGADVVLAQTWDTNHRLSNQVLTATDRLLAGRAYEYRADGHVVGVQDQVAGTRRFELDPAGRVTAVRGDDWTERYAYDSAGNMTAAAWPAADESQGDREYTGTLITRAGRTHYRHDAQGRVVLRQRRTLSGQTRTWHYTWDAEDRLTGVTTPDGTHWVYRYDPFGRRIVKQRLGDGGVVEQVDFTWDGRVLAEQTHTRSGTSRVTAWNWQPNSFRPLTQTERSPQRDASQEWVDDQFYALVTDLIGTPTEMVDSDGHLTWRLRTTLWGRTLAGSCSGVADCPLRFPGQYLDTETGQHYNYFRYYDPESGRYQSVDPLGLRPGPNPQGYPANPLLSSDPLGLDPNFASYFDKELPAPAGDGSTTLYRVSPNERGSSELDQGLDARHFPRNVETLDPDGAARFGDEARVRDFAANRTETHDVGFQVTVPNAWLRDSPIGIRDTGLRGPQAEYIIPRELFPQFNNFPRDPWDPRGR